jgi:hypothetical protein
MILLTFKKNAAAILICSLISVSFLKAQTSPYVVETKVSTATENEPASISVELAQNTQIQQVVIHYRQFGESEYTEADMLVSGRIAVATIPAKFIQPPYVEYYIEMHLTSGPAAFFPTENPLDNPLKFSVKGADPKDAEVRFLSPEPGETVAAEDVAVAISLMFASDAVDKNKTKLFVDNIDITKETIFSDDVILYNPNSAGRSLLLGTHSFAVVLYDTTGKVYYRKEQSFNLSSSIAIQGEKAAVRINTNGQIEYRNEKIDSAATTYLRGDLHANGTYNSLAFGADLHVTNEDKADRQPQNRYSAFLQDGDIFKVQFGDAYPVFPSLFVSGKRVRGLTGSLKLGFFNVDVSWGQINRPVEGTVLKDTIYGDSSTASARPKETKLVDSLEYQLFQSGTYGRSFLAVRTSFGSGENFQWGLSFVKSKDDTSSIVYGTYPEENLVVGTDLLLAADDQKVKWTSQVAFSETNKDISGGSWNDNDFKQLGSGKSDSASVVNDYINTAHIARNFITVNDQLWPANPMGPTVPSLAVESELTLNYLNNFLRVFVFRRGSTYISFGNDYVQTDIMGLNVSDRIRMLNNRVMASLSYETKADNTDHTAMPTTHYNTITTSVTAIPGSDLPTFSVGLVLSTRKNSVTLDANATIIDSSEVANDATQRFYGSVSYNFDFLARQSFSLSVSTAKKTDDTYFLHNQNNFNLSTSLTTNYAIPLQTTISAVLSTNASFQADTSTVSGIFSYLPSTIEQTFNYQMVSFNARMRVIEDELNAFATIAPSFGAFSRVLYQAGADYQIVKNHFIVAQMDFVHNSGASNNVIASLAYRFSF